jgi:aryl-alcohol dehydrogenase-like predicted oxidoreductase
LQSDHIDIYYVHRWDKSTPEEETLRALDDLVRSGKVRYLGVSALPAWQVAHANAVAELKSWTDFVVVQSHYHLLERGVEAEVLPYCNAYKVGFIPFFPMAGGFLTGKYKRGEPAPAGSRGENSEYVKKYMTDANYTRVEKLSAWAAEHNHAMNELAQAWLLAQPGVCSVISGATKVDQILSNVNAFEWKLTTGELDEIRAILTA